jgi:hypothetical protein
MEDFEAYRNKMLQKTIKETVECCGMEPQMGVGDDFTAAKYFGNMRFSPKLRKKLTDKQKRSKTGMI